MLAVVVYVLTGLAAVVVALTRLRLSGPGGGGQIKVGSRVLGVHTVAGSMAFVVWVVFLVPGPSESVPLSVVGIVGLGLWWVTTLAGLALLARWLPSRGRHSVARSSDSWSSGPGLSMLAHLGMLVGVVVFTWAYLVSAV